MMNNIETQQLRQKYLSYLILGQNLVYEITNQYPEVLNDQETMMELNILNQYLIEPNINSEFIELLGTQIQKVQELVYKKESGNKNGYQKVKSNGTYVEAEEIKKPNYTFDFIPSEPVYSKTNRGVDFPYYMTSHGNKINPTTNNRGHSNVFMLSFLTFFFEALFLILSLFLYQ